jgi:uncharacterized protein YndB with AHSA1/START domain
MKRDERGKLFVMMGEMGVPVATLELVASPRQATLRGFPDGLLATSFALEEERGGTGVTVTMSGFESLPARAAEERLGPSGAAWEKALANLKAHLDGSELPHPEGYVAALFGYRREGSQRIAVERTIWIAASRERVWQAITDPAQIEQWFSPGTEWRVSEGGDRLSVYNPETDSDMYVQVIELVDPPYQLITRSEAEPPETPHTTIWTLTEEQGGTRLRLTHTGYELAAAEIRQQSMEQNAFGFGMMLENLQAQIEGAALPYPGGF